MDHRAVDYGSSVRKWWVCRWSRGVTNLQLRLADSQKTAAYLPNPYLRFLCKQCEKPTAAFLQERNKNILFICSTLKWWKTKAICNEFWRESIGYIWIYKIIIKSSQCIIHYAPYLLLWFIILFLLLTTIKLSHHTAANYIKESSDKNQAFVLL